jgi:hypothetical protein
MHYERSHAAKFLAPGFSTATTYPARRWRKTVEALKLRYRCPDTARHRSVSWNLMLGRSLLWVSKQRGHRTVTMLQTYAAWIDNAVDTDVEAIRQGMGLSPDDPGHVIRAMRQTVSTSASSNRVTIRNRLQKFWLQICHQTALIKGEALLLSQRLLCPFAR